MAYLALYRKYRPKNFNEVIGQEYVTQILKNQIVGDRIGHAYLLTGIRGTGKTSIAKIFARAMNCTESKDGNPCGTCESCQHIEQAGVMDIIEIDAASNRGVDEIRDIRDKVIYPPKIGRYKVYIIDEVHMLTKEAFNALLKTLEEPPSHVVFILATTEPNKLPATILSRCQRFDIRPISSAMIVNQIKKILQELDIGMENEAIQLIAKRGDHSMRDALSILDQAIDIRHKDEIITLNRVEEFLGMTNQDMLMNLITAIIQKKSEKMIEALNSIVQKGTNSLLLMGQIIDTLRQFIIIKTVGKKASDFLEKTSSEIQEMEKIAQAISVNRLYDMIDQLIEDRQKMRYNDLSGIILEMALLKVCSEEEGWKQIEATQSGQVNVPKITLAKAVKKEGARSEQQKEREIRDVEREEMNLPKEGLDQGWENSMPEPPEEKIDINLAVSPANQMEMSKKERTNPVNANAEKDVLREETVNKITTEKSDSETIKKVKQAVEDWKASQDFFTAQIVTYGKLIQSEENHFEMIFQAPDHNMYAEMFKGRIQNQIQDILNKALQAQIRLTVSCSEKHYEEMDLVEKTAAIVGDAYREKIQVTD